jgi:hypothetical protein
MSATLARMRGLSLLLHPMRLVKLVLGLVAFLVYVWFAAVRAIPNVKRRKAAMRRYWRERHLARRSRTAGRR